MADNNNCVVVHDRCSQVKSGTNGAVRKRPVSFAEIVDHVRAQIEIERFPHRQTARAEEIAMVIAEIMYLSPRFTVRINGSDLPVRLVTHIYSRVTHDHVERVIENMAKVTHEIKHMKTYLRTAIYNSVFELDFAVENDVAADLPPIPPR